ncbi:MAG: type II toxin-antitoxin system ParD family antitoxin [Roseitalea porphyridii]|uniref:type II toxin-antitoxin system ParD family antitoxin n=1 Tax=Roseitalea porphyridii TaxID=1852022 RepID=UPI0032D91143
MGKTLKRTVSLPQAAADYIDRKVDSGEYGSASEVVREGLRALRERDAAIEKWLREEVVPTYEAVKADPSQLLTHEEFFAGVRDRIANRQRER